MSKETTYESWEKASRAAQKLGIQTPNEYANRCHEDPKLPLNPPIEYTDWEQKGGWSAFLDNDDLNI